METNETGETLALTPAKSTETPKISPPHQDLLPSPEPKTAFRTLKLDLQHSALELPTETKMAEGVINGLNAVKFWSAHRTEYLPKERKAGKIPAETASLTQEVNLIQLLLSGMSDMMRSHYNLLDSEFRPAGELIAEFEKVLKDVNQKNRQFPTETLTPNLLEVPVHNAEELELLLRKKLRAIIHDVNNPIAAAKGYLQLAQRNPRHWETCTDAVNRALSAINGVVDGQMESLIKDFKFEQQDVSPAQLTKAFWEDAVGPLSSQERQVDTSVFIDPRIPKEASIAWSPFWLGILFSNIAQNTARAYQADDEANPKERNQPRTFKMRVEPTDDGQYLLIHFDDQGIGYSQKLLEEGFRGASQKGIHGYGTTGVKSEGIAMARHAEILEKHYGGQIFPSRPLDDEGRIVQGARTTIKLPLKA